MHSADSGTAHTSLADRYRVLLDIGRTLAGTLSHDDLHRAIYRETAQVLEASGFYVALYDEPRDLATVVFYADRGQERHVEITFRGSDSDVIRTGEASLVDDRVGLQSLIVLGEDDDRSDITRAAISAPLRHKGRILGSISAQSYKASAYSPEDLELLQGIADIAAVAVENARFVHELDHRRREAEQIERIGRALTASLDADEVLGKVIEAALALLDVDGATVWLRQGTEMRVAATGGDIAIPVGARWDIDGPIFERLVEGREPVIIDDLEASRLVPDHLREHLRGGSGLAVPLVVGDAVAGTLSTGSSATRFFTDEDTRVLQRVAGQASVALQNARLHASLQALSLTDPLTGLPNRRHLEMHLEREIAAAQRGRELILVLFDLDNFKRYNDTFGHLAGDEALRAFAHVLGDENRAMNLVARYGGDEFVAVLSETGEGGADPYLERVVRRVIANPVLSQGEITVSCGIARFEPHRMDSAEDVLRAADDDLYRVKGVRGPDEPPRDSRLRPRESA